MYQTERLLQHQTVLPPASRCSSSTSSSCCSATCPYCSHCCCHCCYISTAELPALATHLGVLAHGLPLHQQLKEHAGQDGRC